MKTLAFALALVTFATAADAQQRPFSPSIPCRQLQGIVAANGAVVIGTGTYTYDRYVRDGSFCQRDETIEPAWIPSRDTPQCPVGYRCRSQDYLFDR